VKESRQDPIDPAWLAQFYFVLAWSNSALAHDVNRHPVFRHLSLEEVASRTTKWCEVADKALQASNWMMRPQLRAVQAMLLKISFDAHLAFTSDAYYDVDAEKHAPSITRNSPKRTAFFMWHASAIRSCQLLGLHRLGQDPTVMPVPDAAYPVQACSLRRELAKRIWYLCMYIYH